MLNRIPFTADEFFGVFSAYNRAVWPVPLVLMALAVVLVWLVTRPTRVSANIVWLGLAALWLWSGVAYHVLHFSTINPLAYAFGALFVLQGILFVRMAGQAPVPVSTARFDIVGGVLLFYALVAYPVIGVLAGEHYPAMPTFGAPCPITIYTFGLLLVMRRPLPLQLLVIPSAWALVGSFAAISFGVVQDLALPVAAASALGLLYWRRRHESRSSGPSCIRYEEAAGELSDPLT